MLKKFCLDRLNLKLEDIIMKKRIQSVKGVAVLERLRIVLDESGMSGRQFAEKIGLKAESATRLFNGVTGLTKPLAYSIELHFGLRSQWLLTGEGLKSEQGKRRNMPDDRIERLIDTMRNLTDELSKFRQINVELSEIKTIRSETKKLREQLRDKELFTRGLQEQTRRKPTIN